MARPIVLLLLPCWLGASLLLAEVRPLVRPPLEDRLRPHQAGAAPATAPGRAPGLRASLGPLAGRAGERLATWLGVTEPVGLRLRRIHAGVTPGAFRLRQFAISAGGGAAAVVGCGLVRPPIPVAVALCGGAAALGFLVVEQQLALASERRRARTLRELPVVAEQLAMLMAAGYSLGGAMARVAERGNGCCAQDLAVVVSRIRQGLSEAQALREWAEIADVEALRRLVDVLALDRATADLGRLVADEARAVRREVHRRLLEEIERRAQQVWVPVTVATLVPGAIVLAIPFLEALRLFSST